MFYTEMYENATLLFSDECQSRGLCILNPTPSYIRLFIVFLYFSIDIVKNLCYEDIVLLLK